MQNVILIPIASVFDLIITTHSCGVSCVVLQSIQIVFSKTLFSHATSIFKGIDPFNLNLREKKCHLGFHHKNVTTINSNGHDYIGGSTSNDHDPRTSRGEEGGC